MGYDFDWASLQRAWPYLAEGLQMTAFLVVAAMAATTRKAVICSPSAR